jgi:hypothetical protein
MIDADSGIQKLLLPRPLYRCDAPGWNAGKLGDFGVEASSGMGDIEPNYLLPGARCAHRKDGLAG